MTECKVCGKKDLEKYVEFTQYVNHDCIEFKMCASCAVKVNEQVDNERWYTDNKKPTVDYRFDPIADGSIGLEFWKKITYINHQQQKHIGTILATDEKSSTFKLNFEGSLLTNEEITLLNLKMSFYSFEGKFEVDK